MVDRVADGRVHQVSVSPGGVPKRAVAAARIGRQGVEGDRQAHPHVHGGPHRAVALLALEAIERVAAEGHPIAPGAVGENLTTSGIELALLPIGTRLAIGTEVVLEIASPANPCDLIKGAFRDGKSGRISILTHPADSRMYARVVAEGEVRPGDPIRVLPPAGDGRAETLRLLERLEATEWEAWLTLWRAAQGAGYDVRILDQDDLIVAASPDLPGSIFNRALGLRLVPALEDRARDLFRAAGVRGWLALEEPPRPDAVADSRVGIHGGPLVVPLAAVVPGLTIREIGPDEAETWAETMVAAFEMDGPIAAAWRRFSPHLAASRGQRQLLAELDGQPIGVASLFVRRRVAWLGAGGVVPRARGRGIQRALIADRLARGAAAGAEWATATADEGSVSAANLTAMGLPRLWSRVLYPVDPEG